MSSEREGGKFKRISVIKGVGPIDEIRKYKGEKIVSMVKSISIAPLNESVVNVPTAVDIYYVMYLPVPLPDYEMASGASDEELMTRLTIVQNLLASSKLQKVKSYTTADSLTSMVATASFLEKLNKLFQTSGGEGKKDQENRQTSPESNYQDSSGGSSDSNENIKESIEKALEKALEDAKVAKEIKGLMARVGAGNTSILSYAENPEDVLKLARETDISKILEKLSVSSSCSRGGQRNSNVTRWAG